MSDAASLSVPSVSGRGASARWRLLRLGLLVGLALSATALIAVLFPLYLRDRSADRIVKVVAQDWRDFGQATAEQRLHMELARSGLVGLVQPSDCAWSEGSGRWTVECAWSTRLTIPGTGTSLPLRFDARGEASSPMTSP